MAETDKNQNLYNLSILISQDGFSFSIYQSKTPNVTSFASEEFDNIQNHEVLLEKVENAILKHQISAYAFNQIYVYYQTPKYVICPEELFKVEEVSNLFTLTHTLDELEEIRYVRIYSLRAYMIFSMPTELVTLLMKHFEGCTIYPSVWSHLAYLQGNEDFALLHITPRLFDMMVVKSGRLAHLNTFYYQVNNDFLYFTLNTLKQLGLDSNAINIQMQGDISRFNQKFLQLKQFAPHLAIVDTKPIHGPIELTNQLKLKHWTLFKPLCA